MREYFYYIVEIITEAITGLNHNNLKLWNFMTYIEKSQDVSMGLNLMIAACIGLTILTIVTLIIYTKNRTFLED